MPMQSKETNEKLREWYCKVLKVDVICDECLSNIEKSRKDYMTRKNVKQGVMINVDTSKTT
jgi:predicted metal-binding transcription factor (methanogenesis marker protein 9)